MHAHINTGHCVHFFLFHQYFIDVKINWLTLMHAISLHSWKIYGTTMAISFKMIPYFVFVNMDEYATNIIIPLGHRIISPRDIHHFPILLHTHDPKYMVGTAQALLNDQQHTANSHYCLVTPYGGILTQYWFGNGVLLDGTRRVKLLLNYNR